MMRLLPLALLVPTLLMAQASDPASTDTIFVRAQRMVAEGQGDAGRALVQQQLDAAPAGSPKYVEALYWRAALASTAADAERDLKRIVIEYALSPRADDALMRLAQLEMARGDRDQALAHLQRVVTEHPSSPSRARASYWMARTLFEQKKDVPGCTRLTDARSNAAAGDVELRNQIDYYAPRCESVDAANATAATAAPTAVSSSASTPAPPTTATATPATPPSAAPPQSAAPPPNAMPSTGGISTAATPMGGAPTGGTPTSATPTAALPTPSVSTATPGVNTATPSGSTVTPSGTLATPPAAAQAPAASPPPATTSSSGPTSEPPPQLSVPTPAHPDVPAAMPRKSEPVTSSTVTAAPPTPRPVTAPPKAASPGAATAKSPPTATPKASASATSATAYTVQVGAYNTHAEAVALQARLRTRGIETRVAGTQRPFRVRIGRYPTQAAANAEATKLKASKIDCFVTEAEAP